MTMIPLLKRAKPEAKEPVQKHTPKPPDLSEYSHPKMTDSQWRADKVWLDGMLKREQEQKMSKSESAFEKLVTTVRNRDKCSRQDAMHKAREEYPIAFEVFQKEQAAKPTPTLAKANPTQKAADDKFEKVINDIRQRDKCSRQDAMSKARTEHPAEFEAYQNG